MEGLTPTHTQDRATRRGDKPCQHLLLGRKRGDGVLQVVAKAVKLGRRGKVRWLNGQTAPGRERAHLLLQPVSLLLCGFDGVRGAVALLLGPRFVARIGVARFGTRCGHPDLLLRVLAAGNGALGPGGGLGE